MPDRKKVMQWLEICVSGCEEECPYEYENLVYRVECKADLMRDALALLEEQETIIRCKDCKYWLPMNRFYPDYHPGRGQCELNCWARDSDWFCADGDRR